MKNIRVTRKLLDQMRTNKGGYTLRAYKLLGIDWEERSFVPIDNSIGKWIDVPDDFDPRDYRLTIAELKEQQESVGYSPDLKEIRLSVAALRTLFNSKLDRLDLLLADYERAQVYEASEAMRQLGLTDFEFETNKQDYTDTLDEL